MRPLASIKSNNTEMFPGCSNCFLVFLSLVLLNVAAVIDVEAKLDPAAYERMALIANDYNDEPVNKHVNADSLYNNFYYDTLDLDEKVKAHFRELDPSENHCELVADDTLSQSGNSLQVFCWQIPDKCTQICTELGGLNFELDSLQKASFKKFSIQQPMEFKFKSLQRIEADAFNGLVVGKNVKFTISIEGPDNMDVSILPHSFRGIVLEEHAEIAIRIAGYKHVVFERESLLDISYSAHNFASVAVKQAHIVLFRSGCMQAWKPLARAMFNLNVSDVGELVFEKHSFSEIEQWPGDLLQIEASGFEKCRLGTESFSRMRQAAQSSFLLSLSGKRLTLSDRLFMGTTQSDLSNHNLFFKISDSSLCIKPFTFGNILQGRNSTFRSTYLLSEDNSVVFNKHAIVNYMQNVNSKFEVYAIKLNQLVIESESIVNMTQDEKSFFEVWVSKAKTNFKIKHIGISGFVQAKDSTVNIGFTSSKSGEFKQSPNAFSQFVSQPTSKVIYDFSKNSKFKLDFAPRPIPRFLPLPPAKSDAESGEDSESSNKQQVRESIEEIAFRIFPNLGRTSRPDTLDLNDYSLGSEDFCKISQIPFDVLVKLRADTECSCPVYFLYRLMRKIRKSDTNWLANTPDCYQNKYHMLTSSEEPSIIDTDRSLELIENVQMDRSNGHVDLKMLEEMCNFDALVKSCQESNNVFEDPNYDFSQSLNCESPFDYYIQDSPVLDSSDISSGTTADESLSSGNENVVLVDQYDDELDENIFHAEDKQTNTDTANTELESNVENKFEPSNTIFTFLFQKLSLILLFVTGIIGSILLSAFMIVSVLNKFRSDKEGFLDYSADTTMYKNDRFYDSDGGDEHIYTTIPNSENYNNQLVTSVKNKFNDKINNAKYAKFDNQSLDSSIAETYNTSMGSLNIKANPFV